MVPSPLRLVRRPDRIPRGPFPPASSSPPIVRWPTGMPFILDCAPIVDGYTADIGFTASLGDNPALDRVLDDLAGYRALILDLVRTGASQRQVYRAVDRAGGRPGLPGPPPGVSVPRHRPPGVSGQPVTGRADCARVRGGSRRAAFGLRRRHWDLFGPRPRAPGWTVTAVERGARVGPPPDPGAVGGGAPPRSAGRGRQVRGAAGGGRRRRLLAGQRPAPRAPVAPRGRR